MKSLDKDVLHICNSYSTSSLYRNLVQAICNNSENIVQHVYVPVRSSEELNKNTLDSSKVNYTFSLILNKFDRILYFKKIKKIKKDILKKVDFDSRKIIHSHFLFSNGGVAYLLKKSCGVRYITAVRNTDINVFYRYMRHLKPFAYKILQNAERIIFLSPTYIEHLKKILKPTEFLAIEHKFVVIPNGIDEFWLKNKGIPKELSNSELNLLFVGSFAKGKNIKTTINVVKKMNLRKGRNVRLSIVGGSGSNEKDILEIIESNKQFITYYGPIKDMDKLMEVYRSADIFLMPSFTETFGLVYAEALSQGLPIIYSKGQGFDNQFPDGHVGYSVNPTNEDEIINKIEEIIRNYSYLSSNAIEGCVKFNWDDISLKYIDIYSSVK